MSWSYLNVEYFSVKILLKIIDCGLRNCSLHHCVFIQMTSNKIYVLYLSSHHNSRLIIWWFTFILNSYSINIRITIHIAQIQSTNSWQKSIWVIFVQMLDIYYNVLKFHLNSLIQAFLHYSIMKSLFFNYRIFTLSRKHIFAKESNNFQWIFSH